MPSALFLNVLIFRIISKINLLFKRDVNINADMA